MSTVFRLLLLAGLLVCAVATALVKKPLRAVIIYMAYSIIMSVIWILLEAPDLALTEAAVGAGITGILFFLTLRRIDRIDRDADVEETQGEEEPHEENEAACMWRRTSLSRRLWSPISPSGIGTPSYAPCGAPCGFIMCWPSCCAPCLRR